MVIDHNHQRTMRNADDNADTNSNADGNCHSDSNSNPDGITDALRRHNNGELYGSCSGYS